MSLGKDEFGFDKWVVEYFWRSVLQVVYYYMS